MIKQEDVTIIIPHLGATDQQVNALNECLTSLLETCECPIIVAKNGEGATPYTHVSPRVVGMALEQQGQCMAVNAAVATVNTPWVLVTNDDQVYPPGWFEKLTQTTIDDIATVGIAENVLCLSPQLVEPRAGAPTFLAEFCGGAGGDFDKQKFLNYVEKHESAGVRTGFNTPFLIKKELWDLIQGYDVNYDPWGSNSDSDLEYKIRLAGIQPYQNTNCLVYHFGQNSGTFHPDNRGFWDKNWHYFIIKTPINKPN